MFTPPPDTPGPNPIEAALAQYRAAMFAQNQDVGPAAEAKARALLGRGFTYGRGGDGFNAWRTPLPTEAQLAASDASVAKSIAGQPAPQSGPGGYNPVPDIMELRGNNLSQVSGYGIKQPSNLNIRDYKAKEAVAANDQTKANAFMVQANAEQGKAQAAGDEVALRSDPLYQKFLMDYAAAQQGNPPNSVGVQEAQRDAMARRGIGVPAGATLPPALEATESLEKRGVAPGSPEAAAVAATYPAEVKSGLAGEPVGVIETGRDLLYGGAGTLFGALGFPQAKLGTDMILEKLRSRRSSPYQRMYGPGPSAPVGVPSPDKSRSRPGVGAVNQASAPALGGLRPPAAEAKSRQLIDGIVNGMLFPSGGR